MGNTANCLVKGTLPPVKKKPQTNNSKNKAKKPQNKGKRR